MNRRERRECEDFYHGLHGWENGLTAKVAKDAKQRKFDCGERMAAKAQIRNPKQIQNFRGNARNGMAWLEIRDVPYGVGLPVTLIPRLDFGSA